MIIQVEFGDKAGVVSLSVATIPYRTLKGKKEVKIKLDGK